MIYDDFVWEIKKNECVTKWRKNGGGRKQWEDTDAHLYMSGALKAAVNGKEI